MIGLVLEILAAIVFAIAAIGVKVPDPIVLVPLGLFLWVLASIVGRAQTQR